MTFNEACNIILGSNANGYAKGYALAGLEMVGHEVRVQALYILNNISHWRGPEAKAVRAALKEMVK